MSSFNHSVLVKLAKISNLMSKGLDEHRDPDDRDMCINQALSELRGVICGMLPLVVEEEYQSHNTTKQEK